MTTVAASNREGKPAGRLYPWDRWLRPRRGTLRLVQGDDFACGRATFAQQVRNAASLRDLRISLTETREGFQLTVHEGQR